MPSTRSRAGANLPAVVQQGSMLQEVTGRSALAQRPRSALSHLLEQKPKATKRQEREAEEVQTRVVAQESYAILHGFAAEKIVQMHVRTHAAYCWTVGTINTRTQMIRDKQTRQDVMAWNSVQKEMLARHLAGNLEGAVYQIAELAHRPLYEAPEEEVGFLRAIAKAIW